MRIPARIILIALLCASCSVKEVRHECPCRVEIDFSGFANLSGNVFLDLNGRVFNLPIRNDASVVSTFEVTKTDQIKIRAWCGVSRMVSSPGVLSVREGEESDSLYLFAASAPGTGEKVRVQAVPHKQFANVLLRVIPEEGQISYSVRSNYGSISMQDGRALPGDLLIPLSGAEGDHLFRLPRQSPVSMLVLEARYTDGLVHVYPLGEWIKRAGYDWDVPDLDDIVVGADFALGHFEVGVEDWSGGEETDQPL